MKSQLLWALILIRYCSPEDLPESHVGICFNLHKLVKTEEAVDEFTRIAQNWPKFSGNPSYPVPASASQINQNSIDNAYYIYSGATSKWSGEYGKLRYELLDFTIGQLLKEVFT